MTMTRFSLTGAAAAALLALSLPAAASTFTVSQQNAGDLHNGNGFVNTTVTWSGGNTGTRAGVFAVNAAELGGDFLAWCLDIGHTLGLPSEYSITSAPFDHPGGTIADATKANLLKLVNTAYTAVLASLGTANKTTYTAAFQMALWEILDETDADAGYNVKTGNTRVSNGAGEAVVLQANAFLSGMDGDATGKYKLTYLQSETRVPGQSLVTVSAVPLPAAGLLLFGALGGLGVVARRRKSAEA